MAVEPASHLSVEAQEYLRNPLDPPPAFDFADLAAVAAARESLHREWLALNDQMTEPWVYREDVIADIPVVWFASDEANFESTDVLVHLHGGSYFLGSPMTNAAIPVPVAQRTGLPIVSIDYRLAPEHQCPTAAEDAVAVCTAVGEHRTIAAMFGESAGGGLAVATALALRDRGAPLPHRLALLSPWVDLTCSGDTYRTLLHADPDFPDPDEPHRWAAAYAGEATADPAASPLFADLHDLPPTLIQVGGREILLSDACRLDAALRRVGVATTLDIWDGLWHVWQLWHHLPEAQTAFDELAEFMTKELN